jgi:hypothetical protein
MNSLRATIVLFMLVAFTSGCTTVQPWERGNLSKKEMAWTPDPLEGQLREHVFFAKEAASGGYGSAGGGCGCN